LEPAASAGDAHRSRAPRAAHGGRPKKSPAASAGDAHRIRAPRGGPLRLADSDLHVWQATLRQPARVLRELRTTLSGDERTRADRISSETERRRFVVARGVLRDILGRYLGVEPDRIELAYEKHGRPRLAETFAGSGVSFNLSHAGDLALYAFSRGRAVGVDVESVRRRVHDAERLARRFFSPTEYDAFLALPEEQKPLAFLRCWTRKEAFIKAIGEGLARSLSSFDVSFRPGEPPALLGTRPDPEEARRWRLHALEPDSEHIGAVAVAGDCRLKRLRWEAPALPGGSNRKSSG
jgi:4'-phosphopantetheinyl transferase